LEGLLTLVTLGAHYLFGALHVGDLQDPNRLAGIGAEEAPPIEEATRISFGILSGISKCISWSAAGLNG